MTARNIADWMWQDGAYDSASPPNAEDRVDGPPDPELDDPPRAHYHCCGRPITNRERVVEWGDDAWCEACWNREYDW